MSHHQGLISDALVPEAVLLLDLIDTETCPVVVNSPFHSLLFLKKTGIRMICDRCLLFGSHSKFFFD